MKYLCLVVFAEQQLDALFARAAAALTDESVGQLLADLLPEPEAQRFLAQRLAELAD